jgi:hypothetical protein
MNVKRVRGEAGIVVLLGTRFDSLCLFAELVRDLLTVTRRLHDLKWLRATSWFNRENR